MNKYNTKCVSNNTVLIFSIGPIFCGIEKETPDNDMEYTDEEYDIDMEYDVESEEVTKEKIREHITQNNLGTIQNILLTTPVYTFTGPTRCAYIKVAPSYSFFVTYPQFFKTSKFIPDIHIRACSPIFPDKFIHQDYKKGKLCFSPNVEWMFLCMKNNQYEKRNYSNSSYDDIILTI